MGVKTAVLVVSFGTSHTDTLGKTIEAIEGRIGLEFPGYVVRRAFTSGIIMKIWRERGVVIDSVGDALLSLVDEGFETVIVQPTHIINGVEYEKMLAQIQPFMARTRIHAGTPLLTDVHDYKEVARALVSDAGNMDSDEMIVFMGHGSSHHSSSAYSQMEYVFHDMGFTRSIIGTVEGYPGLEEVKRRLRERAEIKKVCLQPFMVVAGDHAKNDMSGSGPDSWKSVLEQMGYSVTCNMRGLGEYGAIRDLFSRHARAACG